MLLKLWPIIWFQMDQIHHKSSVFISLVDWIHSACNRSMGIFSHKGSTIFLASMKYTFPFLFYRHHKILHKLDGLVGSLNIWFLLSNLPPCGLGSFHPTWHMSVVLGRPPYGIHIFYIWSTSGDIYFDSSDVCHDLFFQYCCHLLSCGQG